MVFRPLCDSDETGAGQHIDMSLLDTATAFLANQGMNYLATGTPPGRTGNTHPNIVPYQVFEVSDGHVIIATGNNGQYQRLCDVLGLGALKSHPDYEENKDRVANRDQLVPLLEAATLKWAKADLLAALEEVKVPAGPINDLGEVFADPQILARGVGINPEGVPGIRSPWNFSESELALDRTAPKLGQHNGQTWKS